MQPSEVWIFCVHSCLFPMRLQQHPVDMFSATKEFTLMFLNSTWNTHAQAYRCVAQYRERKVQLCDGGSEVEADEEGVGRGTVLLKKGDNGLTMQLYLHSSTVFEHSANNLIPAFEYADTICCISFSSHRSPCTCPLCMTMHITFNETAIPQNSVTQFLSTHFHRLNAKKRKRFPTQIGRRPKFAVDVVTFK